MATKSRTTDIPANPRDWRPQQYRPTRRTPAIRDPILEPLWSGLRVMAHFRADVSGDGTGALQLLDADGVEVSDIATEAAEALRGAVLAIDAVIDGILTRQATTGGEGAGIVPWAEISPTGMLLPRTPELTFAPSKDAPRDTPIAFVGLDLLVVDGQPLFDLPLLERKRVLESLIVESELVRVSPHVRPPIGQWLSSWQSAGFRGVMMKAANSRYRPGELSAEWTAIERINKR